MIQCTKYEEYSKVAELVKMQGCFNFTTNGECSKCGSCCSTFLPLKKSEIDCLRQLIKKRHIKPHTQPLVVNAIDLTCPFLTDDNKCSIYDERPFICRIFKCDTKPTAEDVAKLDEPLIPVNLRELF